MIFIGKATKKGGPKFYCAHGEGGEGEVPYAASWRYQNCGLKYGAQTTSNHISKVLVFKISQ